MSLKLKPDGLLISIEGIDGAGKSTLARHIVEQLQKLSLPVISTREPGGTDFGKWIRTCLQEQKHPMCLKSEFLLFAADRAQHFHELIMPHLKQGFIVISDRLDDSSIVYQGIVKGLDIPMIKTVNEWCMGGRKPDLILYVQLDANTAIDRIKKNRDEITAFEQDLLKDKMEKISIGFESLFANRDNVVIINGLEDQKTVAAQAVEAIIQLMRQ